LQGYDPQGIFGEYETCRNKIAINLQSLVRPLSNGVETDDEGGNLTAYLTAPPMNSGEKV